MFYLVMVKLLGFNRDIGKPSLSIHLPAVATSLIFAFSYDFWQQTSASGKFYSLNVLLVAAMLFIMILWYEEIMYFRNENNNHFAERMTIFLAFIMGLSLTDHMLPMWFIAVYVVSLLPFVIYILIKDGSLKFKKEFMVRIPSILILLLLVLVSLTLLMKYMVAIKPIIYPAHTPMILIGWFLVPAYLSIYTILIRVKKKFGFKAAAVIFFLLILSGIGGLIYFGSYANEAHFIPNTQYPLNLFSIDLVNENGVPTPIIIDPIFIIFLALITMIIFFYGIYDGALKKSDVEFGLADKFIEILTYSGWMFIFAMTLYLYLMVRNIALAPLQGQGPQSWGDTVTLDILFNHMFRKQYYSHPDYANLGGRIMAVLKVTLAQFNWAGIIFAILGFLYLLLVRNSVWALYTLMAYVISYAGLILYINFQIDPATMSTQKQYFSQLHLLIALYISFGFQLILDLSQGRIKLKNLLFIKNNRRG